MEHSRGRKKSFSKDNNRRRSNTAGKFDDKKKKDNAFDKPARKPVKKDNTTRLNKYMAHAGICSRRDADTYIKAGVVTVNGEVVTEMGYQVKRGDDIRFNGQRLSTEQKVYILLNKPKDFTTVLEDRHSERTVIDLIAGACRERVYPVGRLDKKSTGVLLLTNDGEMTAKLTNPRYNKKKIYHVQLHKNLSGEDFEKIMNGIEIDKGTVAPKEMSFIVPGDQKQVGIEINSGRNQIVRRMFEHLGYKVVKLDRVLFAGLTKKGIARGKWRFLNEKEINFLKMS